MSDDVKEDIKKTLKKCRGKKEQTNLCRVHTLDGIIHMVGVYVEKGAEKGEFNCMYLVASGKYKIELP